MSAPIGAGGSNSSFSALSLSNDESGAGQAAADAPWRKGDEAAPSAAQAPKKTPFIRDGIITEGPWEGFHAHVVFGCSEEEVKRFDGVVLDDH